MGWKDLLLSLGGARGTRESVRQQFRMAMGQSGQETHSLESLRNAVSPNQVNLSRTMMNILSTPSHWGL